MVLLRFPEITVSLQTFLEVVVKRNSGALRAFKLALADRLDTMPMLRADAKVSRSQSMLSLQP